MLYHTNALMKGAYHTWKCGKSPREPFLLGSLEINRRGRWSQAIWRKMSLKVLRLSSSKISGYDTRWSIACRDSERHKERNLANVIDESFLTHFLDASLQNSSPDGGSVDPTCTGALWIIRRESAWYLRKGIIIRRESYFDNGSGKLVPCDAGSGTIWE